MTRKARRAGFTLIELLVVVMIIAILAAVGIPKYQKTVETAKAQDAATTLALVGKANQMYAVDNNGVGVYGVLTNACAGGSSGGWDIGTSCSLVTGNYLANVNWNSKAWLFAACSPGHPYANCALSTGIPVAAAAELSSVWYYIYNNDGSIQCACNTTLVTCGSSDAACNGASPPKPN